jgi:hypothetical protein
VVDASQLQPLWWARSSAVVIEVLFVAKGVLFGWTAWTLLGAAVFPLLAVLITASPTLLGVFGSATLPRLVLLVMSLLNVVLALLLMLVPDPLPPELVFGLWVDLIYPSLFYFAACRPPKPPLPRGRLAPGGA